MKRNNKVIRISCVIIIRKVRARNDVTKTRKRKKTNLSKYEQINIKQHIQNLYKKILFLWYLIT